MSRPKSPNAAPKAARLYVAGKRVAANRLDTARTARWEVIRLAWLARWEAAHGSTPGEQAAGGLLGSLLGAASNVGVVVNQLGPRVTGGDRTAIDASRLLADLRERLAEQNEAA